MRGNVFLFVGIILIGAGALCYYMIGRDSTVMVVNGQRSTSASTKAIVQWSVGGGLAALGLLFVVGGVKAGSRAKKHQKEVAHIMQTGIAVDGTVTFVDKNYSMLVNKRPIYSIVEYVYEDRNGQKHTRRVETIPSDYVIRNNIQVGGKVAIKYATEDYSKSTILLV